MVARIQVSAQSSAVAGQAGHCAEEIPHLYSGERMLLARTRGVQILCGAEIEHRVLDGEDQEEPGKGP